MARVRVLIVDDSAFEPPIADESLRPHGLACCQKHAPSPVVLTEFADPDGEATYFLPASACHPVVDELLKS